MIREIGASFATFLLIAVVISEPVLALASPTAAFIYYPVLPYVNRVTTFDASSSNPGGPGITIVNYRWNFGDGTPIVNTPNNVTTHTFTAANNYTVTLNVTNSQGLSSVTSKIVTVYQLNLTVGTDKTQYQKYQETVYVNGNFTWSPNNNPVIQGIVGVEIRDPVGDPFLFRTRPTSSVAAEGWLVNFTQLYPCGSNQVPKYSFTKGEEVWVFAEWKNFDAVAHPVMTAINLFDSNSAPINHPDITAGGVPLGPGLTGQRFFKVTAITDFGVTGTVTVYASLFSDYPMNGGYPHCPEGAVTFTISGSAKASQEAASENVYLAGTDGTYGLFFRFPPAAMRIGPVGTYKLYVSTYYYYAILTKNVSFTVFVIGDINGDGVVDIFDAIILSRAYGYGPGDPGWDPKADLNADLIVDIFDAIMLSNHYGEGT